MGLALRVVCVALLCVLLALVIDGAVLWDLLRQVHLGWIAVATLCLVVQTMLMAQRWRLVAACLGLSFSYAWALREYLLAQVLNQSLPGGVVGEGARVLRSATGGQGHRRAVQAVVAERLAGQVGLLAVACFGLGLALVSPGLLMAAGAIVQRLALGAVALAGVTVVGALSLRRSRVIGIARRCLPTWRIGLTQAALSIGAALLNVAAFAACARGTGTPLDIPATLVLVPLILTAMLIPLSIAGWGWREGAAAIVFPLIGASAEAGIAASILFGAVMILSLLPALPLLLWRSAGRPVAVAHPGISGVP